MLATYKNTRGSIMVAALIITLITATLVGLFLRTVTLEVKNSYRTRMGFQAVNLAEAGLEYAIHSMIHEDWDSWTKGGKGYYRDSFSEISSSTLSLNHDQRSAKVYVQPGWTKSGKATPVAIAEGTISSRSGVVVKRQIRIEMQRGSSSPWKRGWGNGILGKDGVTFSGNKVWIDSYRSSSPVNIPGYSPGYDPDNMIDNGSVASNSVAVGAISVGNADIFGRVATGGGAPDVGPKGSIFGPGDKEGTKDPNRIALDFYADIPDPVAPSMSYPETSISGLTIGLENTKTQYRLAEIDIDNNEVYTVYGNVVMIVTGVIDIKGTLTLAENSSLEVYVDGDIDIGGTGIANDSGIPPNMLMFATGENQNIKIHGNGAYVGVIHAPNADITLDGGGATGELYGAVIGKTVTFKGNGYDFHYDEDLSALNDDDDDDDTFVPVVNDWAELTDSGVRITDWEDLLNNGFADQ